MGKKQKNCDPADPAGWPVRTLARRDARGRLQPRTPAMSARLADHPWSLHEWLTFPSVQRK